MLRLIFHFIPKCSLKLELHKAENPKTLQIGLLQRVFAVFWHKIYLGGVCMKLLKELS